MRQKIKIEFEGEHVAENVEIGTLDVEDEDQLDIVGI